MTRLLMSGILARENSGKIREKFGKNLRRDGTTQYHSGNSWMVLKWVPNKKIPEQYWYLGISGIEIQNFQIREFGNSGLIFGVETGREVASLEWAGIKWDQKWLVLNAREGIFPTFSRKKFGTQKMQNTKENYYAGRKWGFVLLTMYFEWSTKAT